MGYSGMTARRASGLKNIPAEWFSGTEKLLIEIERLPFRTRLSASRVFFLQQKLHLRRPDRLLWTESGGSCINSCIWS